MASLQTAELDDKNIKDVLGRQLQHVPSCSCNKEEKILPFPQKLYMMLESVDRLGLSHTVSWLSNGRSFQVKDPIKFMDSTVPHFFKATKFRSFQRQLNLWGFQRATRHSNVWSHKTFIRGCPEKLPCIYRTKIKGNVHATKDKQAYSSTHLKHSSSSSLSADVAGTMVDEDALQDSECGSSGSVRADTIQVSNATSPEVSFSHDAFDAKVNALFSMEDIPPIDDGGYLSKVMTFQPRPRVFDDESGESDDISLTNTFKTWDDMSIEIEPLPINCFKVLGSENQTQNADLDDFQKFLGRLIK